MEHTILAVHVNPYFLRLSFCSEIVEDDHSSAVYDPSSGHLTITVTKHVKGEDFKDLDLLPKLLATEPSLPRTPLIEFVNEQDGIERGTC